MTLTLKTPEIDPATEKALRLPVGVASPLWFMIGSAAMVGAAVFWATRWLKPTNLEAELPEPSVLPKPEPEVAAARALAEPAALVETVIDPVIEAPVLVPAMPARPDDLTVMTGIGPKLAAMLADKGVTRFEQIAAWTDSDIAAIDKELKLMGRVVREAWVDQAKRLAGA